MNAYNPQTEQLEFLAGDKIVQQSYADGTPGEYIPELAGLVGRSNTIRLDKAALGHPLIRFTDASGKDYVLEADVYALPGAPPRADGSPALEVLIICPRCQHQLSIKSDRKLVEYVPGAPELDEHTHQPVARGTISIEAFECTWEMNPEDPVTGQRAGDLHKRSENLCRLRLVIDKNLARSW